MSSGCGDVLSLEDLKTAKKHQLFEAEVITGKTGGVAGGSPIDYATNQATGQTQKTMPAILRDIGFIPASFDFTSGGTLTVNMRDYAVLWPLPGGDGDWYYWEGALPKVIPASSTPNSTGGVANGAWRPVGDITLRGQLASTTGATLVGYGSTTVKGQLDVLVGANFNVTPEQYGAVGNGTTDDTAAITAAIATGRNVVSGKANARYRVTNTIVFPNSNANGQVIDFLGSTLFADHVNAVFSRPTVVTLPTIDNVHFRNMNVEGIASVDSVYNSVSNNVCFPLGDNSTVLNVSVKNIGTDAFSFNGYNGRGDMLTCDNIRDNPIAMRGTHNYVSSVKVGHCAGDMLLMKGSYNRVESASGKKCGVPGSNPEPGFIAGGIAIFGAPVDGDDLGRNNSVGFVEVEQWGALGIGFSGDRCRVDVMKLGDCYFADDSPLVQNNQPWVVIARGNNNSIGEIRSKSSPYGVLMLSATDCSIDTAYIYGTSKVQFQVNNTAIDCRVGTIAFNTYRSLGIIPNGTRFVVENMIFNNFSAAATSIMARINSNTTHIENITINGIGTGSGTGCAVELSNVAIVSNITSTGFSGLSLWVRPTGKVPRMVNVTNNSDSTVPCVTVSATNSCCCGWIIRNFNGPGQPTVFQESGTTVISTWIGCENSIPVAQGGATLNALAANNRFY